MIPVTPFRVMTSEPIRPRHLSGNMEVVARDIRDSLARRWLRSTTPFRFGAFDNTTPAVQRTMLIVPSVDLLLTGVYVGFYAATTVTCTVTVNVNGSPVYVRTFTGLGATMRLDWSEGFAELTEAQSVTIVAEASGTVNNLHVGLAMEHDRFQGAPPSPPSPVRFGYTDPASLRTILNTFSAAVASAISDDENAEGQTDIDLIRGPSGVASGTVTSDTYTIQIPDTGRTVKSATLYVVADVGVVLTARIIDASAVTQHTLQGTGIDSSTAVTDTDVVGDTQPGAGATSAANDWTLVFSVGGAAGTIQESYVSIEWE